MPDTRTRRGPAPRDRDVFGETHVPTLRRACSELSWLLSHGYSPKASLKLVGDRHRLTERQRKALQRTAASDQDCARRRETRRSPEDLAGTAIEVDGYNVLLTVEAALSGGLLLLARDGALRDLAALSRHYKRLSVTRPALRHIGGWLSEHHVSRVQWWFDRPISNSGRLATTLREVADEFDWPWQVELVANPDALLRASSRIVATADSAILDRCTGWISLARHVVEDSVSRDAPVWSLDLSGD